MPLTAWLIGAKAERVLPDLTAPNGYPPAEIWIPLDSSANTQRHRMPRYRSAWAYRTTAGENWLDFAIPADTILEAIGPHALAYPKTITQATALASNTQTKDGVFMVKVPRYFAAVATTWRFEEGEQKPLALKRKRQAFETTLGEVDMSHYTGYSYGNDVEPDLIIADDGPLLLSRVHQAKYYTVDRLRSVSRVISALRKLPPETLIRSVAYTA